MGCVLPLRIERSLANGAGTIDRGRFAGHRGSQGTGLAAPRRSIKARSSFAPSSTCGRTTARANHCTVEPRHQPRSSFAPSSTCGRTTARANHGTVEPLHQPQSSFAPSSTFGRTTARANHGTVEPLHGRTTAPTAKFLRAVIDLRSNHCTGDHGTVEPLHGRTTARANHGAGEPRHGRTTARANHGTGEPRRGRTTARIARFSRAVIDLRANRCTPLAETLQSLPAVPAAARDSLASRRSREPSRTHAGLPFRRPRR